MKNQLSGFGYDAAGNMTSNGSATYTYDAENRLIATAGMSYIYDGDGKRVKKCTEGTTPGTCATSATGMLYWGVPGGDTLTETDLAGTVLRNYVFFNGQRIGRRDVADASIHYYFSDHLGSHSLVTDANGDMPPQEESDFYPFGEEIPITTGDTNHYKFTGKERDAESGLDNFGARYNASSLGRMMSPDSGADQHPEVPQSWNLYSYVRNNPLNAVDPNGEFTCGTSVSKEQCENAHLSVEKAEKGLDAIKQRHGENSQEYKDAKRSIDALGGRKDNGVKLEIGDPGPMGGGTVSVGSSTASTADNPNGQNIRITMTKGSFDGSEGAGIEISHEGSHAADASAWIASGFKGTVNAYSSEMHAYDAEIAFSEALVHPDRLRGPVTGNEYTLWGYGMVTFQSRDVARTILKNEYGINRNSTAIFDWQRQTKGGH